MDLAAILLALRSLTDLIHTNLPKNPLFSGKTLAQVVAGALSLFTTFGLNLHPLAIPGTAIAPAGSLGHGLLNALALWMGTLGTDGVLKHFNQGGDK